MALDTIFKIGKKELWEIVDSGPQKDQIARITPEDIKARFMTRPEYSSMSAEGFLRTVNPGWREYDTIEQLKASKPGWTFSGQPSQELAQANIDYAALEARTSSRMLTYKQLEEGMKMDRATLLANPEIAKALIGPNYQTLLGSDREGDYQRYKSVGFARYSGQVGQSYGSTLDKYIQSLSDPSPGLVTPTGEYLSGAAAKARLPELIQGELNQTINQYKAAGVDPSTVPWLTQKFQQAGIATPWANMGQATSRILGDTQSRAPLTSNLTKVPTGSIGPDGKPIYDVFAGTEYIKDPSDPRLKGVNIFNLPTGQAPSGFQSKFLPVAPPSPPKTGAGAAAGAGVVDNQAIIDGINAGANEDMKSALNLLLNSGTKIDTSSSAKLTEKLLAMLEGITTKAPEEPKSLRELFDEEKTKLGVSGLEQNLADTDAKIAKLDAEFLGQVEEGEQAQISTREISRNLSAKELLYNRQKRELLLEKDRVQNQITQKYDTLNTILNLEKFDISQATDAYNTRFSQTLQVINLVKGLDEAQKNDIERATDNARANAQIVINTMSATGTTWSELSGDQQLKLQNLGLQSGLGQNFFADTLAVSSGKEILTHIVSTDKTYATIVYKDGTTKLVKTGLSPQAPDTPKSDVGAKYTTRLNAEIANVYSGRYGLQGAREQALRILKAEFPSMDVAKDIYNRIPDGYEANVKNASQLNFEDI